MTSADFNSIFLGSTIDSIEAIDNSEVEQLVSVIKTQCRDKGGRLFIVGSGGGAGHASHAACDFRKICEIETYAVSDNVSELTARTNDEGWDKAYSGYLKGSRFNANDCLMVFSVGGGSVEKKISMNLVEAMQLAKSVGASIVGVVGRDGGFTAEVADAAIVIKTPSEELTTPIVESLQALVWHLLASHPALKLNKTKWEEAADTNNFAAAKNRPTEIHSFNCKIFADGADLTEISRLAANPLISGFTTNPTLMRKAGVEDYSEFAKKALTLIGDKPISFEVFADELPTMEAQARTIASWGKNIYVKIPITTTKGVFTTPIIKNLSDAGVKLNVTAITTVEQVAEIMPALKNSQGAYISVFAGRIADTGVDPLPIMKASLRLCKLWPNIELLWASPRELLNIIQASQSGCHIITVTHDLLAKLALVGKDLNQYSLETVKMFYDDATKSGFSLEVDSAPPESATVTAHS